MTSKTKPINNRLTASQTVWIDFRGCTDFGSSARRAVWAELMVKVTRSRRNTMAFPDLNRVVIWASAEPLLQIPEQACSWMADNY